MITEHIRVEKIEKYNSKAKIILSNSQIYFLPLEVFLTHQLVESIVLTDSQFEIIEYESSLFEAFSKAKQYLAMRDHSSGELKLKLKKKKFSDEIIAQIIVKCQKLGFLDDERYAYALAEKLIVKKPCGKAYLLSYLHTKLISRDISGRIATMIFASRDIQELARTALEKKWYMYDQLELEDARNKSYNYLARRGFSFGEAKDAFENVYTKKQKDENN